ncbi:MAG TPA: 50S ribosomal protein L11 methyltransferase [Patescibacteria group bacterium]
MFFDILLIVVVLLAAYYLGIFKGAPFVPTDKLTLERMIMLAEIKPGEKLADLGSGDGRIIIAAAKAGAIAYGFEINPLLVLWSRYKIKKAGLADRAFVHWKSFWRVDFTPFDVVMLFGITGIMARLGQKLKAELKPGSRVISNIFKFPNWSGEKVGAVIVYKSFGKS